MVTAALHRLPLSPLRHIAFAPYADATHRAFICGTFERSLSETYQQRDVEDHEHALKRALVDPAARVVVATPAGAPQEFLGWAVALPTCLVYAYVRFRYRRGRLGEFLGESPIHLGAELIAQVAGDAGWVPAAIWTRDASRMAASGFPLRYDLDEHERFLQLAR